MLQRRLWIGALLLMAFDLVSRAAPREAEAGPAGAVPLVTVQADAHHPGTLLAGTATAQLFRSRDWGESWTPLPFPMASRSMLHAILIDPAEPNTYLVAVSSEYSENAGVFRSTDEGGTWQQLKGLKGIQVWALAFWPGDAKVIAAGATEGVFLSVDGGENWKRTRSDHSVQPHPVVSLAFDPRDRNVLYAGTPHLAWKSSDSGRNWRRLGNGMEADSDIFWIQVDPNRRNRLLAAACSGLYSSIDGGSTWSPLERRGAAFRTYTVVRTPDLPQVVFAGTSGGLLRSNDGGLTWQRLSSEPARSIALVPGSPGRAFIATDHGVLLSDDEGIHWRRPGRPGRESGSSN